jgi:catechol 2,3-dioxygenase-like lactoylglutathione lyase family enzyme
MQVGSLNHVALHVEDVDASVAFYRDVMRFPQLERPAFDFPGAWFRLGQDQELHLIGNRDAPVHSANRGNHFALLVSDLDSWERHLDQVKATRMERRIRPDGAEQIFVCDPDGYWLELCTPPSGSPSSSA